ncbi:MAG TPA: NAD(P)-dependent oxidoreductase [Thermoplasmata archaeon]|nr:NAD(P)-dependent oxidoreductase [Thermoplasmata archaeon]
MRTAMDTPVNPGKVRRVLVVGASGFLGQSVVRAFSRAGYEVRGLVRDPVKGACVGEDGGTPVVGDVLDVRAVRNAAAGCSGIIHLAANPPVEWDSARVRVEGTRNLVDAARRQGVARLVIGSGYWVYRGQPELIDEDSPVEPRGESQINYDAEREGLEANRVGGLQVLVVRPGMVYGNGSWFRGLAEAIRAREYRVVGGGTNHWSFIDRWDVGTAFQAVLESGIAGEVYNAVDGHPAPLREFADFIAANLEVPPPKTVTLETAEREMGEVVARHLAADRPSSAGKLRRLGWKPRIASYRDGVPELLREMFPRNGTTP